MSYIDIETALSKEAGDEFTVKVADTIEEVCKLLEVGFEYMTDMNGKKLFRKREKKTSVVRPKRLEFGGTQGGWRGLPQLPFFRQGCAVTC